MEGTPLLDVMRGLILEPEAQADFAADPSGYMQRFGYDDVPEDDLREAVGLVADTLPPDVAHAVNTAAAAEPGDDDAYGDGTVGLLGRISTAEVTESVVPELDELPPDDAGPDDAFDDDLAGDHDTTTFGEVTRDFDEDTADPDDAPDAAATAGDDVADDTPAEDDAADDQAAGADDGSHDVSFGDGGLDDDAAPTDAAPSDAGPEAFGQGSTSFDAADDELAIDSDDSFDEPGFADDYRLDETAAVPDAPDVPVDDPIDDGIDTIDDGIGAADDFDLGDDPDDFDGDVGQF
jgi:hypothetical protein